MSQLLLSLTETQLTLVDRALTDLETQLFPLAALDGNRQQEDDRGIPSASHQQSRAHLGLAKLDPVRNRLQRLQRLAQQARDAEATLVNEALNSNAYFLLQGATTSLASPDPGAPVAGPTQRLPA